MTTADIPGRREGSHHDTVSMHCLDSGAGQAFEQLSTRLYEIDRWKELNDGIRTEFRLCGDSGEPVQRPPRPGDFIRIDLVGPGSPSGAGYDWVRITAINAGEVPTPWASLTITPCANPAGNDRTIAHFYAEGATNTFIVRQIGQCVTAEVHGRNERPNVHDGPVLDRLRNEAVALAGKVGISKMQWQDWTDGMVSVVEAEANG
ncbi:hypothetical protein CLV84_1258 [Neolewinella xylanilytica]|uniref:Uncharacterized protein n=1 Tax=Neolewinella xylanilytica TaxID=1514080 RepID=A0A2S6I9W8_9BACT|nr:hypothetical protein [Neolewinella xylanilytica]PPK88293.1 hypothetical protein CLV84_1258 [Neolewinella xylanilytica]